MPNSVSAELLVTMKRVATVLKEHQMPFALAGGFAVYARGGSGSEHDVDFLIRRDDADKALRLLCERFDGFYTLLVTSGDGFAVVRDAIACKPAIIAETPAWVAMASEFRALAQLPGIESARIYEPEPERVYAWQR